MQTRGSIHGKPFIAAFVNGFGRMCCAVGVIVDIRSSEGSSRRRSSDERLRRLRCFKGDVASRQRAAVDERQTADAESSAPTAAQTTFVDCVVVVRPEISRTFVCT